MFSLWQPHRGVNVWQQQGVDAGWLRWLGSEQEVDVDLGGEQDAKHFLSTCFWCASNYQVSFDLFVYSTIWNYISICIGGGQNKWVILQIRLQQPSFILISSAVSWRENKCLSSGLEEETRWMIMDRNSLRPKSYSSTDQPPKKCKIPASPAKVDGQKFCPKMYSDRFCHISAKDVLSH